MTIWKLGKWIAGLVGFAAAAISIWAYVIDPKPRLLAEVQFIPYRTAPAHRNQYMYVSRKPYESEFQQFMRSKLGKKDEPFLSCVNAMQTFFRNNVPEELSAPKGSEEPIGLWFMRVRNVGRRAATDAFLISPFFQAGELILPGKQPEPQYFPEGRDMPHPRMSLGNVKPGDTVNFFAWTAKQPTATSTTDFQVVFDEGTGNVVDMNEPRRSSAIPFVEGATLGLVAGVAVGWSLFRYWDLRRPVDPMFS